MKCFEVTLYYATQKTPVKSVIFTLTLTGVLNFYQVISVPLAPLIASDAFLRDAMTALQFLLPSSLNSNPT